MSEEKPQKRLVGWKQYAANIAARVCGQSAAGVFYMVGLACYGLSIFTIALWLGNADLNAHPIGQNPRYPILGGFLGGLFLFGLWSAKVLFKRVAKIEPVRLITRHNTGDLPEAETLVRGADQPPLDRQAELLRATQYGKETPAEELLRATLENHPDV